MEKVFVLTDTASAMGKALALDLAKTGGKLVMVARNNERGRETLKEITSASQNSNVDLQLCDLAVLSSVRNLAEIIKLRYEKIDVLINNGSAYKKSRSVTVDGFEEMFAANYLGPFLLTNLLLGSLQAAVQTNGSARILNLTSPTTTPLNFDDLQSEKNFNPLNTFDATKMANLLFTLELARRLENTGITVNAVDAGLARSGGKEGFFLTRLLKRLVSKSKAPEKVSSYIQVLAIDPKFETITGKFLRDGEEIEIPAYALDRAAQQRLWEISESLSNLAATRGNLPVNDPHLHNK